MPRPVLHVLAGPNGSGKSSIGGVRAERKGLTWFNPDRRTRELMGTGLTEHEANAAAWAEGVRKIDEAIAAGVSHAFETTLGGRTITAKIREAAATHDVHIWYCGLASPELHVERVRQRAEAGGHSIPIEKIYERWENAPKNLITLLPHLTNLLVYDNSAPAVDGRARPQLLLHVVDRVLHTPPPHDPDALERVPAWARPVVHAALSEFASPLPAPPSP